MKLRRPAAVAATAFVAGTLIGLHWFELPRYGWLMVAALALGLPLAGRVRLLLVLTLALLAGWFLAAPVAARSARAANLLQAAAASGERVQLHGDVVGTLHQRPASRGETSLRFTLNNLELEVEGRYLPLPRLAVAANWYGPATPKPAAAPPPAIGQRWSCNGIVVPRRRSNTHSAAQQSGITLMLITRARDSARLQPPAASWQARLERGRQTAAARLSHKIGQHGDDVALVHAMMLGYRSTMPRRLSQAFRTSGTIHIFAISGLHVVTIAAILSFVAARLGVPRHLWLLPIAPLLTIYVIATGAQPSAMRAGLMSCLYLLAPLVGRRPDALTILAVTAAALLLANPLQLHNIGFIMSFVMVLGLVVAANPFMYTFRRLTRLQQLHDNLELRTQLGGELAVSRLQRLGLRLITMLLDLLSVSFTAWLISLPLTSTLFGFFPIYSLAANLCVVPLATLTMTLASLSLTLGSLSLHLSALCNQGVWLTTAAMRHVALGVAGWPGASVRYTMPLPLALLWYALLLLVVLHLRRRRQHDRSDPAWLLAARSTPTTTNPPTPPAAEENR